jgi:hypothetical protein
MRQGVVAHLLPLAVPVVLGAEPPPPEIKPIQQSAAAPYGTLTFEVAVLQGRVGLARLNSAQPFLPPAFPVGACQSPLHPA